MEDPPIPATSGAAAARAPASRLGLASRRSDGGTGSTGELDLDLLRRHLERAVERACPPWLSRQADDVVQAAMLRLLDLVGRSERARSFNSSYLHRLAYSALVDEIRALRRRREVAIEDGEGAQMPIESAALGPEKRAEGRRLGDEIADCLKRLVASRRRAVLLHLYGYTGAEAAAMLDRGLKQVRNLTYRGLADLRNCLREKGLEP